MAIEYLEAAESATAVDDLAGRTVSAGCAVLAAVAASDAICCLRLGRRNRSANHTDAVALLEQVVPGGKQLARDLRTVLSEKDAAHYGLTFISDTRLKSVLRATAHLVTTASDLVGI